VYFRECFSSADIDCTVQCLCAVHGLCFCLYSFVFPFDFIAHSLCSRVCCLVFVTFIIPVDSGFVSTVYENKTTITSTRETFPLQPRWLRKSNVLHILCVCVCSLNFPAFKVHATYFTVTCGLPRSNMFSTFAYYLLTYSIEQSPCWEANWFRS
jgi:hypothetical protein